MKTTITKMFMVLLIAFTCLTSVYSQDFANLYGDANLNAAGKTLFHANTNQYYVVGYTQENNLLIPTLTCLDINGNWLWTRNYRENDQRSYFTHLVETPNGDLILGGYMGSGANIDIYAARVDALGNLMWKKRYDTNMRARAIDLVRLNNPAGTAQTYAFSSWISVGTSSSDDLQILKIDGAGNINCHRRFNIGGDDQTVGITAGPQGDILFSGSSSALSWDGYIGRLDAQCNVRDFKRYNDGVSPSLFFGEIEPTIDGGYVVAVNVTGNNAAVIKVDAALNPVWSRYYNPGPNVTHYYLTTDSNGDIYSHGNDGASIWILKHDNNGVLLEHTEANRAGHLSTSPSKVVYSSSPTDPLGFGLLDMRVVVTDQDFNYDCIYEDFEPVILQRNPTVTDRDLVPIDLGIDVVDYDFMGNTPYETVAVCCDLALGDVLIDDALCPDVEDGSITIFGVSNGVGPYTYVWNTSPVQTGATATNLGAGTYTVTITDATGCELIETFTVGLEKEVCCFAADNEIYTQITLPYSISTDQVFEGKIYVDDNVIITVTNGAVLDITNVDMVFGQCAGIEFIDGATLRANNSVFRTCAADMAWKGLSFYGSTGNIINECTFKNATKALDFVSAINSTGVLALSDGIVSNNLFHNNHTSVNVTSNPRFGYAISGNRFLVNQDKPAFDLCGNFSATNHFGIAAVGTSFSQSISHNDFLNSVPTAGYQGYGITFRGSVGMISENNFSDQYRSIQVIGNSNQATALAIENNEIEVTLGTRNNDYQIVLNQFYSPSLIAGNEINNTNSYDDLNLDNAAIYVANTQGATIENNSIEGFKVGVHLDSWVNLSQVIENRIHNSQLYGIYSRRSYRLDISCNEINMDDFRGELGISGIGIGIFELYENEQFDIKSSIHSNCISDCTNSIYFETALTSFWNNLPLVTNNFMYNYSEFGVYNNGYIGSIGTSADAGMNTFWSNDNTAVDVASASTTVTIANNFGVFNIGFPNVQITQNNPFHSTASCAQQIFGMPSQGNLDSDLNCNNLEYLLSPLQRTFTGYRLEEGYMSVLNAEKELYGFERLLTIYNALAVTRIEDATAFMNELLATNLLSETDKKWLQYHNAVHTNNYTTAMTILNSLEQSEQAIIELAQINGVTEANKAQLEIIAESEGRFANTARALLNTELAFNAAELPHYQYIETQTLSEESMILEVYPNPATDMVNIKINLTEGKTYQIEVWDVIGRKVKGQSIDQLTGSIRLDVADLTKGVYVLAITNEDGIVSSTKLMK